jgi:hypothetical protein
MSESVLGHREFGIRETEQMGNIAISIIIGSSVYVTVRAGGPVARTDRL